MDIMQELKRIKYHQKLLLMISTHENPDSLSFFSQIIDWDLEKKDEKTIRHIMCLFDKRLSKEESFDLEIEFFKSINLEVNYNISDIPTLEEFSSYLNALQIEITPKYLLYALKKQGLYENSCEFLLEQYRKK